MEKLLSSWSSTVKSLPESYVFPVDSRPGDTNIPFCNNLPVIDLENALAHDPKNAVQQVFKPCQHFGLFQIISNGKLKSPEHRAITNSTNNRTSIVYSINPRLDSIIKPAKVLTGESNSPLYWAFQFKEFLKAYEEKKDYNEGALGDFKIKV